MTDYKKKLTEALRGGMRYCFPMTGMDGRTTYPELVESEFTGEDGEGFLHFIQSILFNARRAAYLKGYVDCAMKNRGEVSEEVALLDAKYDSEQGWMEYRD